MAKKYEVLLNEEEQALLNNNTFANYEGAGAC